MPPRAAASPPPRDLAVDRLHAGGPPLEVVFLRDATFGEDAAGAREPHRHDYHELLWTRGGSGRHLIDGEPFAVQPGTLVVIGRGQVHVLERARDLTGAVVRFRDEVLDDGSAVRAGAGWLVGRRGSSTVAVPPSEADRLEQLLAMLAAETRRPSDTHAVELQRHLLSIVLLWTERWYDDARTERRDGDDPEVQLYRRFAAALERDFARHHDAGHYADVLAVPPAALSRALVQVTGRTTKELVTERVMLEAARLLRFTDLTAGEIAFRVGFGDQLYFSRAFKRRHGEAPVAYRARWRGD